MSIHQDATHQDSTVTVDFFIVGEPKSGTSALAEFLSGHPQIGISVPKEPHFFATDLIAESDEFHGGRQRHFEVRSAQQYADCFQPVRDKPVLGEGSTHYLCSVDAAANIARHNPRAKIIAMFRNPVDFVHSLHMQYVNNATEDEPDFARALALEPERKQGRHIPERTRCPSHLYYTDRVRYAEHLQRFLEHFPAEEVMVIANEDFGRDNSAVYRDVVRFLGVDDTFTPDFVRVNDSRAPRSRTAHRMLNSLALKNAVRRVAGPRRYDTIKNSVARVAFRRAPRTPLDPQLRAELHERFRPEAVALAALADRPDFLRLWGYADDENDTTTRA